MRSLHMMTALGAIAGISMILGAGCGDDETTTETTSTTAVTTSTTGSGGATASSSSAGGTGGTATTSTGGSGTGGNGTGGDGGAGGGMAGVHGCTMATADDQTGNATLTLGSWTNPHNECVIVDVNTAITWNGSFNAHPLAGGVSPTTDNTSPITTANASGMSETITFDTAGTYPYFCTIHTTGMQGVIYVVE